ncbi:bacteriocin-like protein [Chryseobacterium lactis]|uniref:bacteriocin-like protein n=1 Tax=Chryseobacterium lactis TaxID=1241981 RepID=UPI0026B3BF5A
MKNLKKLNKKSLKTITGAAGICPPPAYYCKEWCTWTGVQRLHCSTELIDEPCDCFSI